MLSSNTHRTDCCHGRFPSAYANILQGKMNNQEFQQILTHLSDTYEPYYRKERKTVLVKAIQAVVFVSFVGCIIGVFLTLYFSYKFPTYYLLFFVPVFIVHFVGYYYMVKQGKASVGFLRKKGFTAIRSCIQEEKELKDLMSRGIKIQLIIEIRTRERINDEPVRTVKPYIQIETFIPRNRS